MLIAAGFVQVEKVLCKTLVIQQHALNYGAEVHHVP